MDPITTFAQLVARASNSTLPPPPQQQLQSLDQIAAIMQLFNSSSSPAYNGSARQGMPGEQAGQDVLLLVRCIAMNGATGQLSAPTAYRVVSMMGDVSFGGLVDAITARLSFSKLPGRQLRSMQACDTDGVQVIIDNDASVNYLFGLLRRDSSVKITVYAVDTASPGETHRPASPTTAATFDSSATPLHGPLPDRVYQSVSPSHSHDTALDGSRGRAYRRTLDRRRLSDSRSASPTVRPREPSRDRGYEGASEVSNSRPQPLSPLSHRSSHRTPSPSPYYGGSDGELNEEEERSIYSRPISRFSEDAPRQRSSLQRLSFNNGWAPLRKENFTTLHPARKERQNTPYAPRYCAVSISETGKGQYKHYVADHLRLRLSSVNRFQKGWSHVLDELFPRKPESEQNPNSIYIERENGTQTVLMLYMRVKPRPQNEYVYDTEGDIGIIINTKALVPGSFKWTVKPDGCLLLRFSTDASFPIIRKNTDPKKDPFKSGPQVNGMNHIAVNIENAPPKRIESPNFQAITALMDAFHSGKGLDVVIETTPSQLTHDAVRLIKFCLGAERDDSLVFDREKPAMKH